MTAASEPIGSPSIDRGPVWDLYASVIGLQRNGRSATFRLYHNPGVNWLWLGALLMVVGGATAFARAPYDGSAGGPGGASRRWRRPRP